MAPGVIRLRNMELARDILAPPPPSRADVSLVCVVSKLPAVFDAWSFFLFAEQ